MSSSWLLKWNNSAASLPADSEEQKKNLLLGPVNSSDPQLSSATHTNGVHTSASTGDLEASGRARSTSPKIPSGLSKNLTLKASTTSLVSMSKGNWLTWGSKARSGSESDGNEENKKEDDTEAPADGNTENDNGEINEENDSNSNDEIDDHIAHTNGSRKKLWSLFGSNSSNGAESGEGKARKEPVQPLSATNNIISSTPAIPSKSDILGTNGENTKEQSAQAVNDGKSAAINKKPDSADPEDDAVLYKPHDLTKQFKKINTHKNENLRENVIVPDWRSCLHHQSSTGSRLAPENLSSVPQSFDIKNWKGFLSHLSARFGFGSQEEEAETTDDGGAPQSVKEREFVSISERSYKLYGRSLAKLPHHKAACLPKRNIQGSALEAKRQKRKAEEDDEGVSITNDAQGNLLINNRALSSAKLSLFLSDAGSLKVGPSRKIKKILIIGVHGFFPTRMIRPLIGSPTGTSLKFANEAEKAVIRFCVENDLINEKESSSVSIQKIALEKEGKIFDRVEFFFEILKKWEKELNEADFIYIAAHSQGCVVSIILFAKLIQMGVLKDPHLKRIGLLGMAGINNGPFYGSDKSLFMKAYSTIEHNSLQELFELTKFDSEQSLVYKESMQAIINANVKLCFIGSINDQLVPLYSALASHIFHPNIYRACYIDHSSKTPEFIKKLVSLCCQMQNLGYFDNNVIKEISTVLAGPLTGGGHSKIYNDGKVYDLGIKFALCTDDIVIPAVPKDQLSALDAVKTPITNQTYVKEFNISKIGTNPYLLPWCLRGLIFNLEKNWPTSDGAISVQRALELRKSGAEEIEELYDLFDRWKPDTKILKDLKFRLNGIRASKL